MLLKAALKCFFKGDNVSKCFVTNHFCLRGFHRYSLNDISIHYCGQLFAAVSCYLIKRLRRSKLKISNCTNRKIRFFPTAKYQMRVVANKAQTFFMPNFEWFFVKLMNGDNLAKFAYSKATFI